MSGRVRTFFASRLNRILVTILILLIVALVVVIPTVDVRDWQDTNESVTTSASADASDASLYAAIRSNFADPCLIKVDGTYYAFATRPIDNVTLHVPVASATNLSRWALHEGYDAMPTLPGWAKQTGDTAVWAPHVVRRVRYFYFLPVES